MASRESACDRFWAASGARKSNPQGNRKCTGQIEGAGTESAHYVDGGGHAVDLAGVWLLLCAFALASVLYATVQSIMSTQPGEAAPSTRTGVYA